MFDDNDQTIRDDVNQHNAAASDDSDRTLRDPVSANRRLKVGDVILGQYEVLGDLGQGGMGVVYRCLDRIGRIEVAVKSLPPELAHDADEMEAVRHNFSLVAKLVHQNIAACRTLAEDKATGECYLVMEYVQGETLKSYLRKHGGKLSMKEALPILRQVADALDFAHQEKVMHRDIKPGNIMICQDGKVKVLDFGLAAQIRSSMSRVSQAYSGNSGTRQYKAPEQWEGQYQGAYTDQYALAVTAYEMLSGNVPFDDDDVGIMFNAVLNGKVPPLPDLPAYANSALAKGLAKKPEERFDNCVDFVRALAGENVLASGKSRFYKLAGLALVVVLAVGLAIAGYCHKQHEAQQQRIIEEQQKAAAEKAAAEKAATERAAAERAAAERAAAERAAAERAAAERAAAERAAAERAAAERAAAERAAAEKAAAEKAAAEKAAAEKAAAEKAAAEKAAAKKVAEGVRKIEDASLKEDFAFINELLLTQDRLNGIRKTLDNLNIDKGQGFGAKLEEFRTSCRVGDAAMNSRLYPNAKIFYGKADEAQKWINENLVLREKALNARKSVENARNTANESGARQWAFASFIQAEEDLKNGGDCFEKAEFEKAKVHFDNAAAGYGKAVKEGRTAHLKSLETQAKAEERGGGEVNWRQILKLADEMEALDSESARKWRDKANAWHLESLETQAKAAERGGGEANWRQILKLADEMEALDRDAARKWRDKANAWLTPSLVLVAMVNGHEVNASVEKEAKQCPMVWKDLSKGDVFNRQITYEKGNSTYAGQLEATVDWTGERKITVHLKKQAFSEIVNLLNNVQLKLIKVEKGSFTMGSKERSDETPHKVHITMDFWLGETEVTQEQYEAIMGENPSWFRNRGKYPVELVNWHNAMEFCKKLTEQERKAGRLPDGYVYTLPTEAQWEFAACGGNKSKGYKYSGSDNLGDVGWYNDNSGGNTHPVKGKSPNELGFYDMSGNVLEWCRDSCEYDTYVVTDTYRDGIYDPLSKSGPLRVCRGGSWYLSARNCGVAYRDFGAPGRGGGHDQGFRVALVPSK